MDFPCEVPDGVKGFIGSMSIVGVALKQNN